LIRFQGRERHAKKGAVRVRCGNFLASTLSDFLLRYLIDHFIDDFIHNRR
jgi:hypothetical protein